VAAVEDGYVVAESDSLVDAVETDLTRPADVEDSQDRGLELMR